MISWLQTLLKPRVWSNFCNSCSIVCKSLCLLNFFRNLKIFFRTWMKWTNIHSRGIESSLWLLKICILGSMWWLISRIIWKDCLSWLFFVSTSRQDRSYLFGRSKSFRLDWLRCRIGMRVVKELKVRNRFMSSILGSMRLIFLSNRNLSCRTWRQSKL